jgi:hypothetical protein
MGEGNTEGKPRNPRANFCMLTVSTKLIFKAQNMGESVKVGLHLVGLAQVH